MTCLCPSVEELSSCAPVWGSNTARSEVVSRTVNRELDAVLRQHKDNRLRPDMVENILGGRKYTGHDGENTWCLAVYQGGGHAS